VTISKARNLSPTNKNGTSDPYCMITSTITKQKFKTKLIKKTAEPVWDQQFKFYTDRLTGILFVKIWDKEIFSDTLLGEIAINLDELPENSEVKGWYTLHNEPKKKPNEQPPGEIRVSIFFPKETQHEEEVQNTNNNKEQKFRDRFTLGEELGRGGFSIVKKGIEMETNKVYAIKIIAKNQSDDELALLKREIEIMRKLKHEHIISLQSVFDEEDNIFLVLELATGGELFDQIISKGTYSERDAASIIRQILEAVAYMHSNGIAHRDLKPENLLVTGENQDVIKISDFGLSKDFGNDNLKTSCGTPDYVAPEVLRGTNYDNSVDVWSVGVITYILLCGFPPFYGNNDQQIFNKILKCEYDFPSPDWDNISDDAKEFIQALLVLNPNERPSSEQCLEAPWIVNKAPSNQTLDNKMKNDLVDYKEKRKKYVNSDI